MPKLFRDSPLLYLHPSVPLSLPLPLSASRAVFFVQTLDRSHLLLRPDGGGESAEEREHDKISTTRETPPNACTEEQARVLLPRLTLNQTVAISNPRVALRPETFEVFLGFLVSSRGSEEETVRECNHES